VLLIAVQLGGGHTWAQSYNLVEDGDTCRITADGVNNTIEGVDPQLGPLADNGGSTQTHALLPGSPALDAGATTLTTDQRGEPRPFGLADDIGAYESQANGTIVIAKQTAPANQGEFDFTHNITATTAFTLAGGQSKTFLNVAPGTYTVTEAIEVAWRLVDLRCDDAASARPLQRRRGYAHRNHRSRAGRDGDLHLHQHQVGDDLYREDDDTGDHQSEFRVHPDHRPRKRRLPAQPRWVIDLPGCGAGSVHRDGDQRASGLATERPDVQRRRQRHAFDGGPGDAHGDHQCGAG
jgi:hypothetical protein